MKSANVMKSIAKSGIKRLLVIDENELYGIVTMSDIINELLEDI